MRAAIVIVCAGCLLLALPSRVLADEPSAWIYLPLGLDNAVPAPPAATVLPTQPLPPTYTPQPTYTPYPTYTPFPSLTPTPEISSTPTDTREPTETRTPTNTRTPTVTRTPTPTAKPSPVCQNVITDGSFEGTFAGWSTQGGGVAVRSRGTFVTPFDGEKVAEIRPANGDIGALFFKKMDSIPKDRLVSASVTYHFEGHTVETVASSDSFLVSIFAGNLSTCGDDCADTLEVIFNQNIVRDWQTRTFDITESVSKTTASWKQWELIFAVSNDVSNQSWWFVDAVSLEICTRP